MPRPLCRRSADRLRFWRTGIARTSNAPVSAAATTVLRSRCPTGLLLLLMPLKCGARSTALCCPLRSVRKGSAYQPQRSFAVATERRLGIAAK